MNEGNGFQLIAAPYTPMDDHGEVNFEVIGRYAQHLVEAGMSGAFVCGTSGEGPSLTVSERKEVLKKWVDHSKNRLKIICHAGGNSIKECQELAAHAEKSGANAVSAFSPFFFKPNSPKELGAFLAEIASAAPGLPFYYYHMPSLTGSYLPVVELLEVVQMSIPNFAGVKYTHSDLFDMQKCIAFGGNKYDIMNGYDEVLLCGLSIGVRSAVGSTFNFMPSVYQNLVKAFRKNDLPQARTLQQFSINIISIMNKYGGPVRAGKAIMSMFDVDCGPCRTPLIPSINEKDLFSLKNELEQFNFFNVMNNRIKI